MVNVEAAEAECRRARDQTQSLIRIAHDPIPLLYPVALGLKFPKTAYGDTYPNLSTGLRGGRRGRVSDEEQNGELSPVEQPSL